MVILVQPPLVMASSGIFLPISSARKLATDLDFYKKTTSNDANIILNLKQQNDGLTSLSEQYKKKTTLLEDDKKLLRDRGDKFETVYKSCSDDLNKCNENTPSRFTWFGIGSVTTAILGIIVIFLIKK